MKNTEMCIIIIVSVFLIGNLVFSSNNYKAVGTTDNRTNGNNNTTKTIASSPASAKCNTSLWNFIANPPGRFKILNQCITVTGKVLSVQYEPDGDTDFPLALDSPYKNMVTKANFNTLMKG